MRFISFITTTHNRFFIHFSMRITWDVTSIQFKIGEIFDEESFYVRSDIVMIISSHLLKDQKPFSSRHSVYDTMQEGNRSVDPRCSRLCIAKLIVHMDAHTFVIPDDVRTLSFAKWYLTSRPVLSTPHEIGSNARTRYPEVSRYRNAEGLLRHGLYISDASPAI